MQGFYFSLLSFILILSAWFKTSKLFILVKFITIPYIRLLAGSCWRNLWNNTAFKFIDDCSHKYAAKVRYYKHILDLGKQSMYLCFKNSLHVNVFTYNDVIFQIYNKNNAKSDLYSRIKRSMTIQTLDHIFHKINGE